MDFRKWEWFIFTAIMSAGFALSIKYLHDSHKWIYLVTFLLFILLTGYGYYRAFDYTQIATGYAAVKAMSIVIVAVAGVLLFSEHLSTTNIIGIIVIITGIILTSL